MTVKPQELEYGGPEWSGQFKCAIREAIAEVVVEHPRKENLVYFTDDAGCLRVLMPDRHERRLTDTEMEALTR